MTSFLKLYFVVGPRDCGDRPWLDVVAEALAGGVTCLQLRDKHMGDEAFLEAAIALKQVAKPFNVPVLLNDRCHLVVAAGADGAHVGQDDADILKARGYVGSDGILGLSVGSDEEMLTHDPKLVDYLGIGPAFATTTKSDAGAPLGPEGVAALVAQTSSPCVAIAGITKDNAGMLNQTGVQGVAVVSALSKAHDAKAAAQDLDKAFDLKT